MLHACYTTIMLTKEKELAIKLRKEGKTYSEILEQVHVAKSTLTEWFKSVQLAVPQKQRITELSIAARLRGAESRRNKRLLEVSELITKGKKEIGKLTERELWLIGTALYWAEGSKQNTRSTSTGILFGNMDFKMILVFLKWLKILKIPEDQINYEIYVHKNRASEAQDFIKWWKSVLDLPKQTVMSIYYKNGNPSTNRSNVGDLYHGLLRIKVKTSTTLNRKVHGWIEGIATQ